MSSLASSQGGGPDVIFYHLPPNFAQAFIVLMQIFAAFLGMSIFDLVCHFSFDVQLLFSKGWREPFKVIARLSYLTCRYTSPVLLICVIIFMTVPIKDCASFITGVNAVLVLNLNAVSLIFVHRTMVLWDWEARVVIPLIAAWLCVLGVSIVVLPWYGVGMSLPNSNFCIFDTRRQERMPYTLSYKISSLALDFAIMCLTLHRLLEGGLRSLFTGKGRSFIGNTGLSKTLARQGFQFFCLQVITDVLFLILYWSFPASEWTFQLAGSAMVFCVPTILAGKVFRDARKVIAAGATSQGSRGESATEHNRSLRKDRDSQHGANSYSATTSPLSFHEGRRRRHPSESDSEGLRKEEDIELAEECDRSPSRGRSRSSIGPLGLGIIAKSPFSRGPGSQIFASSRVTGILPLTSSDHVGELASESLSLPYSHQEADEEAVARAWPRLSRKHVADTTTSRDEPTSTSFAGPIATDGEPGPDQTPFAAHETMVQESNSWSPHTPLDAYPFSPEPARLRPESPELLGNAETSKLY